jgi:phosphatidylserine decarboxylase
MHTYRGDVEDYKSLVDFFIRPLDPATRPLTPTPGHIVSPADGVLQTLETISEDKAAQIKGKYYKVSQLLLEEINFSQEWHIAVIYLSPSDYHRFHYPASGVLEAYCHAGNRLYPVNAMGLTLVDRLFVRNERISLRFDVQGAPLYAVAVGATFVGSIKMSDLPPSKSDNLWKELPEEKDIAQLDEMGRFEMGSTIVLVVPKKMANPLQEKLGRKLAVGEPIFKLNQ